MKKCILILLAAVTCAIFGLSAGEAAYSVDSPFPLQTPDKTVTFYMTDLGNGVNHGVEFFNNVAHTGLGVVLDRDGRPDNSWQGRNRIPGGYAFMAADLNISPFTIWGTADESSSFYTSPYPSQAPDEIQLYTDNVVNGFNHAVVFYNNVANTALAVVLDPDGVPDSNWSCNCGFADLAGYAFLAADFNTPPVMIWGSLNGLAWYCLRGCNN